MCKNSIKTNIEQPSKIREWDAYQNILECAYWTQHVTLPRKKPKPIKSNEPTPKKKKKIFAQHARYKSPIKKNFLEKKTKQKDQTS